MAVRDTRMIIRGTRMIIRGTPIIIGGTPITIRGAPPPIIISGRIVELRRLGWEIGCPTWLNI